MEAWSTFWLLILTANVIAFVPLVLVVTIRGWLDIRHLFRALGQDKRDDPPS
jgi:hypothetical protein